MASNAGPSKPPSPKKGHVCPPSDASHPRDRWETAFVYSFVCRFTHLKTKIEGFDSVTDLEDALMHPVPESHPLLVQMLSRFVTNLRTNTRIPITPDVSLNVSNICTDYMKTSERTVFWDDDMGLNLHPLMDVVGGFFSLEWSLKLKILRQLVEWQLSHNNEIRGTIDRAWGVPHLKHKKKEGPTAPPDPSSPVSQQQLSLVPLGQDKTRKRYWTVDLTPRLYVSTNPWKVTAGFVTISSTREQYMTTLETLRNTAPTPGPNGQPKLRTDRMHHTLVKALEDRIEPMDQEMARIQKAQKKIQQRNILIAQASLRETRTRRQANRPDYAAMVYDSDDEGEEYQYHQEDEDDDVDYGSRSASPRPVGTRRSARSTVNGRTSETNGVPEWRGERRSARRAASGASSGHLSDPDDNSMSLDQNGHNNETFDANPPNNTQVNGVTQLKDTETAVEQVGKKKRSKFWYYAVEPMTPTNGDTPPNGDASHKELPMRAAAVAATETGFQDSLSDTPRSSGEAGSISPVQAKSVGGDSDYDMSDNMDIES